GPPSGPPPNNSLTSRLTREDRSCRSAGGASPATGERRSPPCLATYRFGSGLLLVGPHRLPSLLQDLLRFVAAQDTVLHRLVIVLLQLRVLLHRLFRPLDQGGAGLLEGELLVQRRPTQEGEQGQEHEDRPKDQECSPTHRNPSKPLAGRPRRGPCGLLGRGQRVPQL